MSRGHNDTVLRLNVAQTEPRIGHYATTLVAIEPDGQPIVEVDGQPVVAETTVALELKDVGRRAMMTFLEGDSRQPVITGLFAEPRPTAQRRHLKIRADELDLEASSQITIACGRASITLHRNGKVVVRGVHVISRASGTNRIRGGTIELN